MSPKKIRKATKKSSKQINKIIKKISALTKVVTKTSSQECLEQIKTLELNLDYETRALQKSLDNLRVLEKQSSWQDPNIVKQVPFAKPEYNKIDIRNLN